MRQPRSPSTKSQMMHKQERARVSKILRSMLGLIMLLMGILGILVYASGCTPLPSDATIALAPPAAETYAAIVAECEAERLACAHRAQTIWESVECPRAASHCYGRNDMQAEADLYRCETYRTTTLARISYAHTSSTAWPAPLEQCLGGAS